MRPILSAILHNFWRFSNFLETLRTFLSVFSNFPNYKILTNDLRDLDALICSELNLPTTTWLLPIKGNIGGAGGRVRFGNHSRTPLSPRYAHGLRTEAGRAKSLKWHFLHFERFKSFESYKVPNKILKRQHILGLIYL